MSKRILFVAAGMFLFAAACSEATPDLEGALVPGGKDSGGADTAAPQDSQSGYVDTSGPAPTGQDTTTPTTGVRPDTGTPDTTTPSTGTGVDTTPTGCPGTQENCDGTCVDVQTDTENCGACGTVCDAATPFCVGGSCSECAVAGQTKCGDTCVDILTDVNHCGACDAPCGADQPYCSGGTCAAGIVLECGQQVTLEEGTTTLVTPAACGNGRGHLEANGTSLSGSSAPPMSVAYDGYEESNSANEYYHDFNVPPETVVTFTITGGTAIVKYGTW